MSERQLAYFIFNLVSDPLGNTAGEQNRPTGDTSGSYGDSYLSNGENEIIVTNVMASGIGIANEADVPTCSNLIEVYYNYSANAFKTQTTLDSSYARGVNSWRLTSAIQIAMSVVADVKRTKCRILTGKTTRSTIQLRQIFLT